MKVLPRLAFVLLLAATGCTTTRRSRQDAADLAKSVQAFRAKKQAYVQKLNKDYQTTYAALVDDLIRLTDLATFDQFDRDAQGIADHLLDKWEEATLPQNFQAVFAAGLDAQLQRLADSDAAITATRQKYGDSYRDVSLQLKLLQSIEANLQKLATTPKEEQQLAAMLNKLYELYKKSQAESGKPNP